MTANPFQSPDASQRSDIRKDKDADWSKQRIAIWLFAIFLPAIGNFVGAILSTSMAGNPTLVQVTGAVFVMAPMVLSPLISLTTIWIGPESVTRKIAITFGTGVFTVIVLVVGLLAATVVSGLPL